MENTSKTFFLVLGLVAILVVVLFGLSLDSSKVKRYSFGNSERSCCERLCCKRSCCEKSCCEKQPCPEEPSCESTPPERSSEVLFKSESKEEKCVSNPSCETHCDSCSFYLDQCQCKKYSNCSPRKKRYKGFLKNYLN